MSDRRGSVFVDRAPEPTRAPPTPVPEPVTARQILGAHWTLGRQDVAGAELQSQISAYGPIVQALTDRETETDVFGVKKDHWSNAATAGIPYNTDRIWQDVAKQREADPTFMKDVPATNEAEFVKYVKAQELERRHKAQDVVSRQVGLGQSTIGFAADVGTGFTDPINAGSMILSSGIGGAAKPLLQVMARDALVNGLTEVAELPVISENRQRFGEKMTAGEMATDVLSASAAGALFPVAHAGVAKVAGAAARVIADGPIGQAASRAVAPFALHGADLPPVADHEVAKAFADAVPADIRTPDEQAALHVINRQVDIDATNPFVRNPPGMDTHADRLGSAMADLVAAGDRTGATGAVGPIPAPTRPRALPARAAPNLSPDRVINYVINDLEGGAAVVHYNAADGGTTKYGIAAAANPGVDVANLTAAQASDIAKRKYWLPEFDRADPRTAAISFDASYISGPEVGRRILHESGGDPVKALELYRQHLNHIADVVPGKEKYRKGWMNRVDRLQKLVGGGEDHVTLRPEAIEGDDELALSQRELDHANMDAELANHERAMAGRENAVVEPVAEAPISAEASADAPAVEGSGVVEGRKARAGKAEPALKPTVEPDAAGPVNLGPIFVDPKGKPGIALEPIRGTTFANTNERQIVMRDDNGQPIARVGFRLHENPDGSFDPHRIEARDENYGGLVTYVDPAHRRKGVATAMYNYAKAHGFDLDTVSGKHDMTPDGAAFATARRASGEGPLDPFSQRMVEARARVEAKAAHPTPEHIAEAEHAAREVADQAHTSPPEAQLPGEKPMFDHPAGPAAAAQVESIGHDLRLELEKNPDASFRLGDDEAPRTLADILAEQDADDAAIEAVRGCL